MYIQLPDSENMGQNQSLFLYKLKWSIPQVIYILHFPSCGGKLVNWETFTQELFHITQNFGILWHLLDFLILQKKKNHYKGALLCL